MAFFAVVFFTVVFLAVFFAVVFFAVAFFLDLASKLLFTRTLSFSVLFSCTTRTFNPRSLRFDCDDFAFSAIMTSLIYNNDTKLAAKKQERNKNSLVL